MPARDQPVSRLRDVSREPSPGADRPHEKTRCGSWSEPSRDPIYEDVAEVLERAAEAVEEAAKSLRNVAAMIRG